MVVQYEIQLPAMRRGFHLITDRVVAKLPELPDAGLLNIFLQHTSAGLSINENADPTVREDFETSFRRLVPEGPHSYEGPDDMPAHIKSSLVGVSLTIPIRQGKLALGTWQGIYLCEFRNHGDRRNLLCTLYS